MAEKKHTRLRIFFDIMTKNSEPVEMTALLFIYVFNCILQIICVVITKRARAPYPIDSKIQFLKTKCFTRKKIIDLCRKGLYNKCYKFISAMAAAIRQRTYIVNIGIL